MKAKLTENLWKVLALVVLAGTLVWGQAGQQAGKDAPQEQAKLSNDVSGSSSVPSKVPVADSGFVIGNEDVLAISVWKDAELSRVIPVRSDGKISLPLIGELQATGKTPRQLQAEIVTGLKAYMDEPEVAVIVQEIKSQRFNILGHVQKPGSYLLSPPTTIVDAIAIAGGFRDFAKTKSIYVLRDDGGKQARLPFNYKQVIKGSHAEQNIELKARDTIVVP
jgi:polysaccharide export outer membrane protein